MYYLTISYIALNVLGANAQVQSPQPPPFTLTFSNSTDCTNAATNFASQAQGNLRVFTACNQF